MFLQADFMEMLRTTPEIDSLARWRLIEPFLRLKPQFNAIEDDRERQRRFEDYVEVSVAACVCACVCVRVCVCACVCIYVCSGWYVCGTRCGADLANSRGMPRT